MASRKKAKEEDKKKKKKNDKRPQTNGTALAVTKSPNKGKQSTAVGKAKSPQKKTTPVKFPSKAKTPTKAKPQDDKNKKKEKNKKVEPEELVVPSSSCESEREEEAEENGDEGRRTPNRNSKISKAVKGKKKREETEDGGEEGEEGDEGTMFRFPMARIRRIMTSEAPNLQPGLEGQDVVFLVNKATEMFLEKFCEEAHRCAVRDKKKSLDYKQLATVVSKLGRFDFLSDFVPVKLKAEDALEARKSAAMQQG